MAGSLLFLCAATAVIAGHGESAEVCAEAGASQTADSAERSKIPEEVGVPGRASRSASMVQTQSALMLQTASARFTGHLASMIEADHNELELQDASRSAANDAQFLMRATFGPTRASMAELGATTYEGWITAQMGKPFEPHRVYYRKRANPRFEDYMKPLSVGGGGFGARPRCARFSRWEEVDGSRVSSYTETALPFVKLRPGVLLLGRSQGRLCSLKRHDFIKTKSRYYQHSPRVELFNNTPEKPMAGILRGECPVLIDAKHCRLLPPGHACFAACGSEGEVANDPRLGHHFGFQVRRHNQRPSDLRWDSDHQYKFKQGKTIVWVMQALHAPDQLRQRVAWALAQIFVAAPDFSNDAETEKWLHFYDIFVRNAFGNFRDVLGNVTYSPVMAEYLTMERSWSYDYDKHFPDENYAREIMQLFTIGLEMLKQDGSPQLDSQNKTVPTYGMEEILNSARVFTGFRGAKARSNIEGDEPGNDRVIMFGDGHDIYPKPDLRGGWLGDGYPLCGDLPPRAFLTAGAVYEFRGYKRTHAMTTDIYEVPRSSALFKDLCGRELHGVCTFALRVELARTAECFGGECRMETLRTVQVSSRGVTGFYEYVPPKCVYHFFYNGAQWAGDAQSGAEGVCANPDWPLAGASCCSRSNTCTNKPTRWDNCSSPSTALACSTKGYMTHRFCALACFQLGQGFPGDNCSNGLYREQRVCGHPMTAGVRLAEARESCRARGLEICGGATKNTQECGLNRAWAHPRVWTPRACTTKLEVHWDGKVSGHTESHERNRFAVKWLNGAPPKGTYAVTVEVSAVFAHAPSKTQFLSKLPGLIGAYRPTSECAKRRCGRGNAVCFCGALDQNTVMQFEGRFYKNMRSIVNVAGHKFRNPPVFRVHRIHHRILVTDWGTGGARMSIAEVDAHLDQLFTHPNTAPFIAKLLIGRLVKSNPTGGYVREVARAFKTGKYRGKAYGSQYGDLGATIAAILLHPEALRQTGGPNKGAFREPLLKVMHFMRAMEYKPKQTYIDFGPLMEYLGEAPYGMPTVFNFYDPDFTPDRFDENAHAPEFQIFNGPTSVGILNGLISLIENGLIEERISRHKIIRPGLGHKYREDQGALTFEASDPEAVDATVAELDLLLTGERLMENTKRVVREAYSNATAGEKLKAAQAVIAMSPEFHTYGPVSPRGKAAPFEPAQRHAPRDYKAMVMVFLAGGADSWSFAVPLECGLYEEYKRVRQTVAFTGPDQFFKVSTPGQRCEHFGIHAAMPTIAGLYRDGNAAIVSNIGSLVEPLTRDTLSSARVCAGLFSHKHMSAGLMTSMCQVAGGSPKGVGGRMADALSSGSQRWSTQSFSAGGGNIFSGGRETNVQVIDSKLGNVRFHYADQFGDALKNITAQRNENKFCEEYAQSVAEQLHAASELGDAMDATSMVTDYERKTDLSWQLHQVARLISSRHARKAERDIFFVKLNAWDMHRDVATRLPANMGILDGAIKEFVEELKAKGVFDSVTMVTHSDFGRTLTTNGEGTDHAWAGQQIVIGGGINGERVYNDYPSTLLEHGPDHANEYDIGRGRLIPRYPWESVMVPIAQWMGVDPSQMATVFPNLANFNSSHIIGSARGAALFPGQ